MDIQGVDVFSAVTIVDRTLGLGSKRLEELMYDHVPLPFPPGEYERTVPLFVAEWLYTASNGDKYKVWTKDGDFVCRFGVKNPPQRLVDLVGEHIADCEPIELDPEQIEGTDVKLTRTVKAEAKPLRVPRNELTEKQGAGSNAGALAGR